MRTRGTLQITPGQTPSWLESNTDVIPLRTSVGRVSNAPHGMLAGSLVGILHNKPNPEATLLFLQLQLDVNQDFHGAQTGLTPRLLRRITHCPINKVSFLRCPVWPGHPPAPWLNCFLIRQLIIAAGHRGKGMPFTSAPLCSPKHPGPPLGTL